MKRRFLPSLRGQFGDWTYYSCLMPLWELAERVTYADRLRTSDRLSQMMQRALQNKRAVDIAEYLKSQDERFFNSLVVAVFQGHPAWHEFENIVPQRKSQIEPADLPDETRYSIGFLSFVGTEELFALDGQHRLAGIKKVVEEKQEQLGKAGSLLDDELLNEQVPVIFVAHQDS